jgi:putative DNA primase/helicase
MPTATATKSKARQTAPDFSPALAPVLEANMNDAMRADLAQQLGPGVTVEAIRIARIGYYPAEQCFTFPERSSDGVVIGLLRRYHDGKKRTWPGGKRGLYFVPTGDTEGQAPAPHAEFIRVGDAGVPCPICGRENDGCLVSDEDPEDPACVICVRVSEGAERCLESGAGHFHRRKIVAPTAGGEDSVGLTTAIDGRSVPPTSSSAGPVFYGPTVITEGGSDWLTALSMRFPAIGRPSADLCPKGLTDLVAGKDVILVGDRDPHGVGQHGLESAFQAIKPAARSAVKVLPPEGKGKDLRAWHPIRDEFLAHAEATGSRESDGTLLETKDPRSLALQWLDHAQTDKQGRRLLHYVYGRWYRWNGVCYGQLAPEQLGDELASVFAGRKARVVKSDGGSRTETLEANRHFIEELLFSLRGRCFVPIEPHIHEPFLIKGGTPINLARSVVFRNGLYNVLDGTIEPLAPDLFLTSTLPFDYLPGHRCERFLGAVNTYFEGDQESIDLLQEWFGYLLLASNDFEGILFLIGRSGSGKSTVLTALQAMLGTARWTTMELSDLYDTHGRARLFGRYAAIFSEEDTHDIGRRDAGKVLAALKRISGGDAVTINEKYEKSFSTRLFVRALYSANECPVFSDASRSLARRIHILRFPHVLDAPNRGFKLQIEQEAAGIALWALEGLKRLLANDKFTRPAASEAYTQTIMEDSNPLGGEFDSLLQFAPDAMVSKVDLFGLHVAMAEAERIPVLARNAFFAKFWARYPKVCEGWRIDAGKSTRVVRGVTITQAGYDFIQKYGC